MMTGQQIMTYASYSFENIITLQQLWRSSLFFKTKGWLFWNSLENKLIVQLAQLTCVYLTQVLLQSRLICENQYLHVSIQRYQYRMRAEIELTEIHPVKVAVTEPNQTTLTHPINQQTRIPHINRQTLASTIPSVRRPQNLLLYWLVCIMQAATIFLSLLLAVLPKQQLKWAYLTYIIMTCVRCIIFLSSSLHLVGLIKPLFKLYFLMDNVLLFQIATDITYIFLNYQKDVDYVMGAIVCYPILLFCLCGNGRVMLVYCQWQAWQVILYKMIKLVGSTYFLVYGCYLLIGGTLADGTKQIFLLWVFTTCAFWGEMCFQVNTKDESDNLNTNYVLLDLDQ